MEKELIKLTGIYKSFAGVQALQNVDFTIREGEVRCLEINACPRKRDHAGAWH